MQHDGQSNDCEPMENYHFIMSRQLQYDHSPLVWSHCSKDYITRFLEWVINLYLPFYSLRSIIFQISVLFCSQIASFFMKEIVPLWHDKGWLYWSEIKTRSYCIWKFAKQQFREMLCIFFDTQVVGLSVFMHTNFKMIRPEHRTIKDFGRVLPVLLNGSQQAIHYMGFSKNSSKWKVNILLQNHIKPCHPGDQ